VFAGVSGTAVGDAASIGSIMIPAMKKQGYRADYSAAVTAASSVIGPIIPPSVSMVIAATLLNISVGRLFLAGILPGILLGLGLMGVAYIVAIRQNQPKGERVSWPNRARETVNALWALVMPLLIVGGIVGGIFTPTEAAGIACVYSLLVGLVVYRSLGLRQVPKIMFESLLTSVPIMMLVAVASTFSWIVIAQHVPELIVEALFLISDNPLILLMVINVFLLFVGMFLETNAAILILFPVLFKAAPMLGIDPIHFTIIILLNLMIGLTTPPLGVCLFIAGGISGAKMSSVVKQLVPFLLVSLAVLLAVTYIPALSLAVPTFFYG
jgi:tripartite ATP-independent transporter DctM subunit